jgi:hypothetical protein
MRSSVRFYWCCCPIVAAGIITLTSGCLALTLLATKRRSRHGAVAPM